jgi:hypothetical protein
MVGDAVDMMNRWQLNGLQACWLWLVDHTRNFLRCFISLGRILIVFEEVLVIGPPRSGPGQVVGTAH